jgi:hypothetical protein
LDAGVGVPPPLKSLGAATSETPGGRPGVLLWLRPALRALTSLRE